MQEILSNEFWAARQLAKDACRNSGLPVENHIVEFNEMVSIGSGAEREMSSYKLSRYASYLIVQNADPPKEVVALGQTYFASTSPPSGNCPI